MKQLTFPLSAQNVAEVVAERDAEIERLRAAVMRLHNEVRATVSLAGHAIRESAGNTNYQCLMDAESEARVALGGAYQQPPLIHVGLDDGEPHEGSRNDCSRCNDQQSQDRP